MKNSVHVLFLMTAGIMMVCTSNAQIKTVVGQVTAFEEISVQNAAIRIKSTGELIYSDSTGSFSAQTGMKDILIVSAEGFTKQKVKINKETTVVIVNLSLIRKKEAADLAVGYGHVTDKEKLYAMSSIENSNMDYSRYRSIYQILTDNFTGVQVINGEVIIRNSNSFASGNAALLIVDGREVDNSSFGSILPNDIARINVLKDASSAVYGVRGGNGVVIVETKRGGR
ncbi:MAG: TonB-dependent receptor plug domain-containing protein [Bacteroidales bacterium]|jgi:TonB-dependent SusC/RagA subfamily outer membrane receptor|nr:TonB-dependent receptor plug domain-containing protein [Bacteroidales bacterium]